MDNDKSKFWAILIGVMVAVAIAVTLVDMTIKAAILQESNAFKLLMNEKKHGTGPGPTQANTNGANHNSGNNGSDDSDDVHLFPARVEATSVRKGTARKTGPAAMEGTIEASERARNKRIQAEREQMDAQ
jgi:hypothetical protein